MRCLSLSAMKQKNIEIQVHEKVAKIYLRTDHQEVPDPVEESTHWEGEEAFMECASDEVPTEEEVEEDFEAWFDFACEWQPPRLKSRAQLQADIEYIAAMTGIDLEG